MTPTVTETPSNFADLVQVFLDIINLAIPVLFTAAFVVIVFGLFKAWILDAGTDQGPEQGRNIAFVGIIGLIVMSVIWALVNFLNVSFFA